jgi:hypothetical protein
VVALTTAQVAALKTDQVQALSTNQVKSLETRDVAKLTTNQVANLTTDQIVALTTDQITALTGAQAMALTTDQKGVLSTAQTVSLTVGSPIILDLNGNGVTTQSIDNGVKFDVFGVDHKVNTGWVAGGDGLLVMDRNHDGTVNGGTELFGEGTTLADGKKAANGYAALAELDSSGDGKISSADASFSDLMVWVDGNSDGVSEASELHTLASLGITQLDLKAQASTEVNNGNLVGLTSSYSTADGATHGMADVWFATSNSPSVPAMPPAVNAAPIDLVTPQVKPLASPAATSAVPTDDMRSQVGGMVDAMASFGSVDSAGGVAALAPKGPTAIAPPAPGLSTGMVGIVDALKQFDANGQSVLSVPSGQVASANGVLKTTLGRNPDTDILVAGK